MLLMLSAEHRTASFNNVSDYLILIQIGLKDALPSVLFILVKYLQASILRAMLLFKLSCLIVIKKIHYRNSYILI